MPARLRAHTGGSALAAQPELVQQGVARLGCLTQLASRTHALRLDQVHGLLSEAVHSACKLDDVSVAGDLSQPPYRVQQSSWAEVGRTMGRVQCMRERCLVVLQVCSMLAQVVPAQLQHAPSPGWDFCRQTGPCQQTHKLCTRLKAPASTSLQNL